MYPRSAQVVVETQSNGEIVPRFVSDRHYDPSSVEGRTGEAAAKKIGCRYDTVLILANRVRELNAGHAPYITRTQGNRVTAVQEDEAGLVGYEMFVKNIRARAR